MLKHPELNNRKFHVYPDRARCEDDTMVTLCFEQPLGDGDSVSIRLKSAGCHEQKCCSCERINPYTCRFVLPDHEEGEVQVIILLNEFPIGQQAVTYYSVQSDVIRGVLQIYMFLLAQMGEFLNSRNLIIDELDGMLCDLMNDAEGQQISIHAYEQLFGVWRHQTEKCQTELPTLLHFVGKYGLSGLGTLLMDLPDSSYACRVRNSGGMRPGDLAKRYGNQELSLVFDGVLLELNSRDEENEPVDDSEPSYCLERPVCAEVPDNRQTAALSRIQKAPLNRQVSRSESVYMTMQGGTLKRPQRRESDKGLSSYCQTASAYMFTSAPDYELPVNNGGGEDENSNGSDELNDGTTGRLEDQSDRLSSTNAASNKTSQDFYPDHQVQLLNIMKKVKNEELTIEQAEELVKEWKTRYPNTEKSPCKFPAPPQSTTDGSSEVKSDSKSSSRLTIGLFNRSVSSVPTNEGKSNKSSALKKLRPKWTKSQQSLAIPEKELSTLPDVKQLFGITLDDSVSPRSSITSSTSTSSTSRESCTSYQSTSGIESADENRRVGESSKDGHCRTPNRPNDMKLFDSKAANIYQLEEEITLPNVSPPPPLPPRAGPPARTMGPGQTLSLDRFYSKSQSGSGLSRSESDRSGNRRSLQDDEDLYGSFPIKEDDDADDKKHSGKPQCSRKGSLPFILEIGPSTTQLNVNNSDQSDDDSIEEYIDLDQTMNSVQSFNMIKSNTLPLVDAAIDNKPGYEYKNLTQNVKPSISDLEKAAGNSLRHESTTPTDIYDFVGSVENSNYSKCSREQEKKPSNCLTASNTISVEDERSEQNSVIEDGATCTTHRTEETMDYLARLQMDFQEEMNSTFGLNEISSKAGSGENSKLDSKDISVTESKQNSVIYAQTVRRKVNEGEPNFDDIAASQVPSKPLVLPARNANPPTVRSKPPPPLPPSKRPILNQTTKGNLE